MPGRCAVRVHFVHGWAFDSSIWQALAALLPGVAPSFADRGYFGGAGDAAPQEPAVWITHSLGTMLALEDNLEHCQGLVAIAGFDCFCAGEGAAGVAPRVLDRMLSRFEIAPQQVVTDFRRQCGCDAPTGPIEPEMLRADLAMLRNMDCRPKAVALSVPVLSLHGADDQILPAAMREQTLLGVPDIRHLQHPTAGHLLPAEQPDWCAARITAFLGELC